MSIGAIIATLTSALAAGLATSPPMAATANGAGVDGVAKVKNWPGGWVKDNHAKRVFEAMAAGLFAPIRWVPVQVDPRLVAWVMSDALAIGDKPRARIPINQSNCQRIADKLGKQLGTKLLLITPKIADAVHLHAVNGKGRAIDIVSIWNDPTEPKGANGKTYQGQDVPQWLRQQTRIQKAIVAAGGYPTSGVVSTTGKDVVLSPRIADVVGAHDASGEAPGPKMMIYGWHTKQTPPSFLPNDGKALTAAKWPGVQQGESPRHVDNDDPAGLHGGFWDYSSILRLVMDKCVLDGKADSLATIYGTSPALVYNFRGAPLRAIQARYPLVLAPAP